MPSLIVATTMMVLINAGTTVSGCTEPTGDQRGVDRNTPMPTRDAGGQQNKRNKRTRYREAPCSKTPFVR
jgi:hypothetical protein